MTIKEFKTAVQTEDGTMVAQVFGSKTIMSWGLAPLPFFYNGVYDAISSYISYFKSFVEDLLYPKSGGMAGQTGNIRTPLRPSGI